MSSFEFLTGRSANQILLSPELNTQVHQDILVDLINLREEAAHQGFELAITSAYRSFERQLAIFNSKARGERAIQDEKGQILNPHTLTDEEKLFAILRWSALPGSSRHHWGTDLDVYDKKAVPADYRLQLIPQEFENGGPFSLFHDWLDERMQSHNFTFFRPYSQDRGGVSPERWHLSHRLATSIDKEYTLAIFQKNIEEADIELKNLILEKSSELFLRFVKNTTTPPWP